MNLRQYILTFLFCLLWTASALADCAPTGLTVFPSDSTIRQNPIFVVEGYAQSQQILYGLNKRHSIFLVPIYLLEDKKKIKLIVTETLYGQFNETQVLLKPETMLEAGQEYALVIDNIPESHEPQKFNKIYNRFELARYKVLAGVDNEKPLVKSQPKVVGESIKYYGCGPSTFVIFDFPVKDDSEVIVRTTLKNLETGDKTTYNLTLWENKIHVGHGMCSGAFKLDGSSNFEVEFAFMDASGNITAWTKPPIKFSKPIAETSTKKR